MSKETVNRSRFVRGLIIDHLWSADGGGNNFGLTFKQIKNMFSKGQTDVREDEIRRALNSMVDDKLISDEWDRDQEAHMYSIASRGRKFVDEDYPWELLDDFTGAEGR